MSRADGWGRPKKEFKEEYCDMLIKHMETGLSFEAFAAEIGTGVEQLYGFLEQSESFREAKSYGEAISRRVWEKFAVDNIIDESTAGVGSRKLNNAAWIFNMKNRFKWRDRIDIESDNKHSVSITIDNRAIDKITKLDEIE